MPLAPDTRIALPSDLIPTISDDEASVPDLDGAETGSDSHVSSQLQAGQKRKRASKGTSTADNSDFKRLKKRENVEKEESAGEQSPNEEGTTWAADGEDDGAIDPHFEFEIGDENDGVVEGFEDGWAEAVNGEEEVEEQKGWSIEQIIERRRKHEQRQRARQNGGQLGKEGTDVGKTPGDGLEDESENEFPPGSDDGDEMLADDVFGMGAPQDEEDDDENENAHDESDDEARASESSAPKDGIQMNGNAQGQESDEDDVAAPVPHPDDLAGSDDSSNEENQDSKEEAKRDTFFAPREPADESMALSKTETSFQSMSLSRPILKGLVAVGFTSPTPIQTKTVPVALLGKDVVGGAVTGSGKTAAFILPILERLLYRPKKMPTTRVGILMPTRELAAQCYHVATKLATFTDITFALIVGGLSLREQEQTLKKRPDVVVATPGRFIDHMRNTACFAVENLEILVLDEADRMLEDGFADELNEVLDTIPRSRQTMLFSATMTQDVDKLIRVGLNKPVRLLVDAQKQTVSGLIQEFVKLKWGNPKKETEEDVEFRRLAYLLHLCSRVYTSKTIIFMPTKQLAHRVKIFFALQDMRAGELHGSMSQEQRLASIASFRDGRATHLLATDLASRGLDIPRVETVLNFTVPTTSTSYLHRVGRTARAGRAGVSCTLFSGTKPSAKGNKNAAASERALLKPILRLAKGQGAALRTRTLPADTVAALVEKVKRSQGEIDDVLREEKTERLLAQSDRDVTKGENLVKYEDEIKARPRRTWFQGDKEKRAAKEVGKDERLGVKDGGGGGEAVRVEDKKKKLSGKEKKKLRDRDESRDEGWPGWKKGKAERAGKAGGKPKTRGGGGAKGKKGRR